MSAAVLERADQTQVSVPVVANNSVSGSAVAPLHETAVASVREADPGSGPALPSCDDDHVHRLSAANRFLLLEIHKLENRLKVARKAVALLEAAKCGSAKSCDLAKAVEGILTEWKAATS